MPQNNLYENINWTQFDINEFFYDTDNISGIKNGLDFEDYTHKNWYYLILAIFPISCVIGNILVILAVLTTKTLQTPTNYLLMSLAFADLLVGLILMPFNIYLSINQLRWHLGIKFCKIFVTLDVACSTCSIVHLLLISIDRWIACVRPTEYRTIKHRNRIYILVICAWIFSICLSLPLNGSFDPRGDSAFMQGHHCGIFNPMYMLASSIVAFFVPAIIMILTYGYIFYKLKKRLQAMKLHEMVGGQFIGFGADVSNITQTALGNVLGTNPKKRVLISWEKPLLKNIEETAAEHASSLNDSEREQLQTILEAADDCSEDGISMTISESEYDRPPSIILEAVTLRAPSESGSSSLSLSVPFNKAKRNKSDSNAKILKRKRMSLAPTSASKRIIERRRHSEVTKNDSINSTDSSTNKNNLDPGGASRKMRRLSEMISDWDRNSRPSLSQMYGFARRESLYIARKKLAGLKGWALDLAGKFKNKNGIALRREARLTKLVAILLMAFLISQLPFFIINSYKVYKLWRNEWTTQFEYLFHWATLLGYLNSCLNFFIYSVVNQRFRSSFSRLLGLKRKSKRSTTWMLPPKKHSRRKHKRNKRNASPSTDPSEPRRKSSILSKLGITKPKWVKPRIVIEEVSRASQPKISISQGLTTYRQSSDDDGMRRSSSEIICGFNVVPANYESRRSSGMSNSSASLILHDAHQLLQKSESVDPAEIFV